MCGSYVYEIMKKTHKRYIISYFADHNFILTEASLASAASFTATLSARQVKQIINNWQKENFNTTIFLPLTRSRALLNLAESAKQKEERSSGIKL